MMMIPEDPDLEAGGSIATSSSVPPSSGLPAVAAPDAALRRQTNHAPSVTSSDESTADDNLCPHCRGALPRQEEESRHNRTKLPLCVFRMPDNESRTGVTLCFTVLITLIGLCVSSAYIGLGLEGALNDQHLRFEKQASELATAVRTTWNDFEMAGLWIVQACGTAGSSSNDDMTNNSNVTAADSVRSVSPCSYDDFRRLHDYIFSSGTPLQSIAYLPNVTNAQRPWMEQETRDYYYNKNRSQQHPNGLLPPEYLGFVDFGIDGSRGMEPRSISPFYFPFHWMQGNEDVLLDLDLYASHSSLIEHVAHTQRPAVSSPLPPSAQLEMRGNYVLLLHPGVDTGHSDSDSDIRSNGEYNNINSSNNNNHNNHHSLTGVAAVAIAFYDLIENAAYHSENALRYQKTMYIFYHDQDGNDIFFGVANLARRRLKDADVNADDDDEVIIDIRTGTTIETPVHIEHVENPSTLDELRQNTAASPALLMYEEMVTIGMQTWTVAVLGEPSIYNTAPDENASTWIGGVLIMVACAALALWFHTMMLRESKIEVIRQASEAEKAALVVETAQLAARNERELNNYIAHEVRNPLTSAMSACSFLSAAHKDSVLIGNAETRTCVQEDIQVVDTSLHFINDLLRSMLDMQKAASQQISIQRTPTDISKDVLEPVQAMIHRRRDPQEIRLECPEHLTILADRMRLKQIILNLANNAKKFVDKGHITLHAKVTHDTGNVQLSVEDSGPGIPEQKRQHLFSKFQESLDSLNQGTGLGLCLCKTLVELMGGTIWLDESYDSGVEGRKGTRFVIDLNTKPICWETVGDNDGTLVAKSSHTIASTDPSVAESDEESSQEWESKELPRRLSVLVVDDDMIVRKLLARSLKRVAPDWEILEASSGEAAIAKVGEQHYDLMFLDNYMASVDKQLLGTETAHSLRAEGYNDLIICGISANDMEEAFLNAGADAFMLKPFPMSKEGLNRALLKVCYGHGRSYDAYRSIVSMPWPLPVASNANMPAETNSVLKPVLPARGKKG